MTMRGLMRGVVAAALVLGAAGVARADKFEDLAAKAVRVDDPAALAALFWTSTVDCGKVADDLGRRQCEGVRTAMAEQAADKTYLGWGDGASFGAGDWDATKTAVPITVRACLSCDQTIDVGGERRFVVGKGAVVLQGAAVRGPKVHEAARKFASEDAAKAWKATVVPRLRTQFVFKLSAKPDPFAQGEAKGYQVEVLAFRVYDPCDGGMICSNPPSGNEKADKKMCGGADGSGTEVSGTPDKKTTDKDKPVDKPVDSTPQLPDTLTSSMINRAMGPAKNDVNACFTTYGVPGRARVTIKVNGDGTVQGVVLSGDFQDTPTGQCIVDAVKKTEFPKFKQPVMTIPDYPFILR